MKMAFALVLVVLVAAVAISGCVQQAATGGEPATGKLAEDQATQAVEQEMDLAIGNITLEDVQNELLNQG